ncbi:MAG: MFS transporter [Microcystaceae cyanobacterium]
MNPFKTLQGLDKTTQRSFLLLFLTSLFFWIGLTILLPTLPTYTQDLGGTRQQVGWVMGAFAIGLLGSRVWLGQLVDRRGRKIAILIGTVVGTIAPIAYLLAHSIPPLMAIRAFHGISVAAFTTGSNALTVDLSPAKQRGELIGYMSLAVPVGMALGPALGGYLAESVGYTALFLTSGSCGLLALLVCLPIKELPLETKKEQTPGSNLPESRTIWQLISSQSLLVPALILLLIGLVFGNLATFLPLYIRDIHLALNTGLFYSVAAMTSFMARFWTGQASDTYGRGIFISGSLVCYLVSMLILSLAKTSDLFLLAAALEGIGAGILIPMTIALISDRSEFHERGKVFSVCVSGVDVGIAIAGPLFGWIGEIIGFRGLFTITSALSLIALILFSNQCNPNLKSSWSFAWGRDRDRYAIKA